MSQPQTSPFPPGTTEQVIWTADGQVLPTQEGATGGEIVLTYPDGRVEHILFTTEPQP